MDLNYKILWCEDNDEWYDQISRKVEKYLRSKNIKPELERIKRGDFKIEGYNFNRFEIIIIDYQLEDDTLGDTIIEGIRKNKYYNDIVFYSSNGFRIVEEVLKKKGLQGVFISDRQNRKILDTIQSLINKSLKRSENLINIRGVVMDATSYNDNVIQELISNFFDKLIDENDQNSEVLLGYVSSNLLNNYKEKSQQFISNYSELNNENFKVLLKDKEFNSYMKNRLLNKILNMDFSLKNDLEEIYFTHFSGDKRSGKMQFLKHYNEEVLSRRNDLAHASPETTEDGKVLISSKDGQKVIFNGELCSAIRKSLIKYEKILTDFRLLLK